MLLPYAVIDEDGEVVRRFLTKREALHFSSSTDCVVYTRPTEKRKSNKLLMYEKVVRIASSFDEQSFPF